MLVQNNLSGTNVVMYYNLYFGIKPCHSWYLAVCVIVYYGIRLYNPLMSPDTTHALSSAMHVQYKILIQIYAKCHRLLNMLHGLHIYNAL